MDKITGNISPTKKVSGEVLSSYNIIDGKISNKKKRISGNISSVNVINGIIKYLENN